MGILAPIDRLISRTRRAATDVRPSVRYVHGNPIHTVDSRSLYATMLDGWMGRGSQEILRSSYETLPIFTG